jgi:UDP-N-acetylglucosamine 2-epimerase
LFDLDTTFSSYLKIHILQNYTQGKVGKMIDEMKKLLIAFGTRPEIMKPNQDLFSLTSDLLPKLSIALDEYQPDHVLVRGDTSPSF